MNPIRVDESPHKLEIRKEIHAGSGTYTFTRERRHKGNQAHIHIRIKKS